MRAVSAQGGRIAINTAVATVPAGAPTGTSVVALSLAGLYGGSWSISPNTFFSIDASGVVRTKGTPTVAGKVYRPKATFTSDRDGTYVEVAVSLAINADGPPPAPVILLPKYDESLVRHGAVAGFPYRDTPYDSTATRFTYTGGEFVAYGNMKDANNGAYIRHNPTINRVECGYIRNGELNHLFGHNWSSKGYIPKSGDYVEARFNFYPGGFRDLAFTLNDRVELSLHYQEYNYAIPPEVQGNGVLMSATQNQSDVYSGNGVATPPLAIKNFNRDLLEGTFKVDLEYVKSPAPEAYVSMIRGSNLKSSMTILSSKGAGFATLEGQYPIEADGKPFILRVEDADGSAAAELEVQ